VKARIAVLMPDNPVRASFITPHVMKKLEEIGDVTYNKEGYEPHILAKLLEKAEVCVTGWGCPSFDAEILSKAPGLKMVAHTGGTVAPIVSPDLYDRGIAVISGNELYAESVAEGTVAYILAGLRRIPFYNNLVQRGSWRDDGCENKGILDRKVGIVGFGAIARKLVPMLQPFRADVRVHCKYLSDDECMSYGMTRAGSLEELFSSCDIVSLHLARTPETYHVINKNLLEHMPDGALLINTARGSVVDEQALAGELRTGRIHAVLDVFEEEPLPANSPLRGLDNVILIPHMGGPTGDRRERVSLALVDDIKRFLAGEPLRHAIGREYAMRMTNDTLKF